MGRKPPNVNEENLVGVRIKLYPTEEQAKQLMRQIQLARAIYNLGLEIQNNNHADGNPYISYYDLITKFANMRNHDSRYKWLKESTVGCMRETLDHLDKAFQGFFDKSNPNRYPKFKSRKNEYKSRSFSPRHDRTRVIGDYISISGIKDLKVLAKDHQIPKGTKFYRCSVHYDGLNFWFGASYENYDKTHISMEDKPKTEPVGIDVGLINMITTSYGKFYKFTDTSKLEQRRRKLDRRLSKDYEKYNKIRLATRTKYEDVPKSINHYKRKNKRLKLIKKMVNIRKNDINKATKEIVDRNPEAIVIESISVNEQLHNNYALRSYNDQMMYCEIHRQLKYKARWRNIPVITANKYFPSSKQCSHCGSKGYYINGYRTFVCPICGYTEDRDLNAAYNLRNLAYQQPLVTSEGRETLLLKDIA